MKPNKTSCWLTSNVMILWERSWLTHHLCRGICITSTNISNSFSYLRTFGKWEIAKKQCTTIFAWKKKHLESKRNSKIQTINYDELSSFFTMHQLATKHRKQHIISSNLEKRYAVAKTRKCNLILQTTLEKKAIESNIVILYSKASKLKRKLFTFGNYVFFN